MDIIVRIQGYNRGTNSVVLRRRPKAESEGKVPGVGNLSYIAGHTSTPYYLDQYTDYMGKTCQCPHAWSAFKDMLSKGVDLYFGGCIRNVPISCKYIVTPSRSRCLVASVNGTMAD